MTKLIEYATNVYSQNGEDGIIQEILNRLEIKQGTACEFGAWDGIYLSNTYNLVKHHGWDVVYIEGDPEKYKTLRQTADKRHPHIYPINKMVEISGENSFDNLVKDSFLPIDFDLLSIDIDSYDYQIWESIKKYTPKIVVIEINSSVPPGIEQTHSEKKQGSSFTSTLKLARTKGYSLVCHTGNMIFIKDELLQDKFNDVEINSDNLFLTKWVAHV
jgi:hypothetical protein